MLNLFLISSSSFLRIIYGCLAFGVGLSPWMLSALFFYFLSQSFYKQYVETSLSYHYEGRQYSHEKGFEASDLPILLNVGLVVSFTSFLTFSFYLFQSVNKENYIWGGLFLVIVCYSLLSSWFLATRKKKFSGIFVFNLKDKKSSMTALIIIACYWLAFS